MKSSIGGIPVGQPIRIIADMEFPVKVIALYRCLLLLCFLSLILAHNHATACTIWAASGDRAEGGGTIIAKNRDWRPKGRQLLRMVKPKAGHRYFGLFNDEDESGYVTAGINEPGLVVVSASAPFKRSVRNAMPRMSRLNQLLLQECASVDEALERSCWLLGPRFLLLADKHKTALIEVGLGSEVRIRQTSNGTLYHTNHYVDPDFIPLNQQRKLESSRTRLKRIAALMDTKERFTFSDFIRFSTSRIDGPDNSLSRTGSKPSSTRTMASWIVRLPKDSSPELFITISNPNEEPTEHRLNGSDLFK